MRRLFSFVPVALLMAITAASAEPVAPPTSQPTTAPAVLTWDQAAKHVGETATVTGPVISTHVSADKKNLTLNVGKDYPNPTRFTVFMPNDPKAGAPDTLYKGKTVTVTGKILLYRKAAEMKVTAKDVVVQK